MIGNKLTENFIKDKFPVSDVVESEPILSIHDFDVLIDKYQSAVMNGTVDERVAARSDLKSAYRKILDMVDDQ